MQATSTAQPPELLRVPGRLVDLESLEYPDGVAGEVLRAVGAYQAATQKFLDASFGYTRAPYEQLNALDKERRAARDELFAVFTRYCRPKVAAKEAASE